MKSSNLSQNEARTEITSGYGIKFVYVRQRKKSRPVKDVTGSSISSFPYPLGNVPRGMRTKRKFNGKKEPSILEEKKEPSILEEKKEMQTKRKFKGKKEPSILEEKKEPSRLKEKLDSGVFDNYLEKIWRSFSDDRKRQFAYFDSLWFNIYRTASYKSKVLAWIKKKNIFSKAYVFVPVVCWGHWSLLIFCHFGESSQSTTRSRCMLLLDSLEMADPRRLESEIRRFVLDIYKAEDRPETKNLIYQIPLLVPKVPQQRDDKECGNFVLYFINLFLEQAPDEFSMEGYPYFMEKNWFNHEGLDRFCQRLDSLN